MRAIIVLLAMGFSAIGGAYLGVKYAPQIQPKYVDLSEFSESLREKYRDTSYLYDVERRYELDQIDAAQLAVQESSLGLKALPEDLPPFPFGPLYNPPAEASWLSASLSGEDEVLLTATERWTVANLWATWCSPCVSEMPDIQRAVQLLDGKVGILLVNADGADQDTLEAVTQTYDQQGIKALAPLIAKGFVVDETLVSFGMSRENSRYPANLIYAPGGQPWAIFYGAPSKPGDHWSSPEMIAFLTALSELEPAI